jgi:hypothetical protein
MWQILLPFSKADANTFDDHEDPTTLSLLAIEEENIRDFFSVNAV